MSVGNKTRIAVALSGGVDSATTAALLMTEGYDVIGLTLRITALDDGTRTRRDANIRDAVRVAEQLGIAHTIVDVTDIFYARVITPFVAAYARGLTPNPCAICNRELKCDTLIRAAHDAGASYLATGHYARCIRHDNGNVSLARPRDHARDQSYFLSRLSREQLRSLMFPLAEYTKADLRACAEKYALHVAQKSDSQDICFIEDGRYDAFIADNFPETLRPGPICDVHGVQVGTHNGIQFYTIGQRKGLGAFGARKYVVALHPDTATVVIGDNTDLMRDRIYIENMNWLESVPATDTRCAVRIRSTSPPVACEIISANANSAVVRCDAPQRAVTPGQVGALYDGDIVLGGGFISIPPQ